jgi:hypothetical protein
LAFGEALPTQVLVGAPSGLVSGKAAVRQSIRARIDLHQGIGREHHLDL